MVQIRSVGVELEGGITLGSIRQLRLKYGENFDYGYDSSVHVIGYDDDWIHNAELRFWKERKEIALLYDFIKDAFALGLKQNSTCGNHIHLRLRGEEDLKLVSYVGFWRYFKREIKKWGEERVNERFYNRFCRAQYKEGYENYVKYPYDRYKAINFRAQDKHGDKLRMEVRLLPYADDANQLIKWVRDLVSIIEDFPPRGKRLLLTKREGEVDIEPRREREVVEVFTFSNHCIIELPHLRREMICAL